MPDQPPNLPVDPAGLLALISDLYAQAVAHRQRAERLEAENAALRQRPPDARP